MDGIRLEGDGAIGQTLGVPMVLDCGPKFTGGGAFITLVPAPGNDPQKSMVIYLSPDQGQQLAGYLRKLFP